MSEESNQSDRPTPNQNLRDISHLFLSNIRDQASAGRPRPQRTPPVSATSSQSPAQSVDLTPEEFAQVFNGMPEDSTPAEARDDVASHAGVSVPPVVAIIGAHLNGKQFDRAKEYARHLAASGPRIGLIEVDASEFRVMCFDRHAGESAGDTSAETSYDPRRMTEVLEEMSWDVQRWLLVLPQCRVPEARGLLRECGHWLLLSTCDHDGVISAYRTLKGLTDLWPGGSGGGRPRLSLAMLDAADEEQAARIASKLESVCRQFLNWPIEVEPHVSAGAQAAEHLVMAARPTRDKSQLASAPQWEIVLDFIRRSKQCPRVESNAPLAEPSMQTEAALPGDEPAMAGFRPVMKEIPMTSESFPRAASQSVPHPVMSQPAPAGEEESNVIDVTDSEPGEAGIVNAVLRHSSGELVECPISPPMCPRARLAVNRERRIVMLAVSRPGLQDLGSIAQAYQWLQENSALIGMAVPQLSIDPQQPPHLSLLINQSDTAARTLQPMLQGQPVTVQTYRKLRWGGKTGLLLDAA